MQMQAHRGVCTECPENTMPAFRRAVQQGYPIIELDPKFTADDVCIVLHDFTVNRTCRTAEGEAFVEKIPVADLTWEQVQALDAGLWFGEEFRGTKVPQLAEVLAFARENGVHIKIDNVFAGFPAHRQQLMFDIVAASGADAGFTCPNIDTVKNVVARFPKATIHYDGLVTEEILREVTAALAENPLVAWLPFDNKITAWCKLPKVSKESCAMAHKYGRVGVWILHEEEDRQAAEAMGADIIETTGSLKP